MVQSFVELPSAARYLLAFGVPFLLVTLLTPFAARVAERAGFVDHPGPRKVHARPTPTLGGVAVGIGLLTVGLVGAVRDPAIATIVVCAGAVAILGLVDDRRSVRPQTKLLVEGATGVALWASGTGGGVFGGGLLDLPLTVLWVVAVTNAVNLLDNMDGLAAGVSAMSAFAFFAISANEGHVLVASLAVAIAGALLGFLRHNFPVARIFLGDAGSLLIGFLLAAVSLNLDLIGQGGELRVMIPVLALAVPFLDLTLVVVARVRDGRPVYLGGTDHSSHRLAALGLSHAQVTTSAIAVQAICSASAFALSLSSDRPLAVGALVATAAGIAILVALLRLEHPASPVPGERDVPMGSGGSAGILGAEGTRPDAA